MPRSLRILDIRYPDGVYSAYTVPVIIDILNRCSKLEELLLSESQVSSDINMESYKCKLFKYPRDGILYETKNPRCSPFQYDSIYSAVSHTENIGYLEQLKSLGVDIGKVRPSHLAIKLDPWYARSYDVISYNWVMISCI